MLRAMTLADVLLTRRRRRRRYRLFFRFSRRRVSVFEGVFNVVLRAVTLVNLLRVSLSA
jgi:hypothetical protein